MKKLLLLFASAIIVVACNSKNASTDSIEYAFTEHVKEYVTQDSVTIIVPVTFKSDYNEWSDGWCIDLAMSVFPDFTYEVAEDFTFMRFSDFKKKYDIEYDCNFIQERWNNTFPDVY